MSRSSATLLPAIVAVLFSLSTFSACGDDSPDDEAAAGTGPAAGSGGKGGSSGSGGSKAGRGGSASAGSPSAGAPTGEAGDGAGATSSGQAGDGNGSGGEPSTGAAGGGAIHVPGAAPGGGSVYAVECSGETAMCGTEYAHCLGIGLPDDMTGFSCSNHCETVADCSTEPTGAEAEPGCVQFTMEKRCMLVCNEQGTEYACPDGMSCYVYPGAPIGYCLWM